MVHISEPFEELVSCLHCAITETGYLLNCRGIVIPSGNDRCEGKRAAMSLGGLGYGVVGSVTLPLRCGHQGAQVMSMGSSVTLKSPIWKSGLFTLWVRHFASMRPLKLEVSVFY
jgi:hypothetical protein